MGHFSLIEGRLTTDGNDTFVMETHCDDVCYNVRMTNTGDSLPSLGCDLLIERIEPGVTSKEAMLQYRIQYGRNAGDITGYNWINNRQELNHVAYNDDQIVSLNADGSFVLGPGTFEYHFAFQTYACTSAWMGERGGGCELSVGCKFVFLEHGGCRHRSVFSRLSR